MEESRGFLRQRHSSSSRPTTPTTKDASSLNKSPRKSTSDEVVWGKTPSGQVFLVPTTHDVLTLFHPGYAKSHLDILSLGLLGLQLVLYWYLPKKAAQVVFLLYFAFWRAAYDAGLGWVLTKQSKRKWIVREMHKLGWLDQARSPRIRQWIKDQLVGKMGKDYSFDDLPLEYNTWLLFRQAVDVILLNDFLAYCMFAFSCFRVPEGLSFSVHLMRWIGGIALIGFNVWVKTEAHNVVKDYGWYWGDVFFQRGALVFDGVFELAPHPMYSVGYAGYYGLSLISGSYAVLFASLAGHAAQFAFLVFFENPHIERAYGQRKLVAQRSPVFVAQTPKDSPRSQSQTTTNGAATDLSTPAATEGETATESELETETEAENTPRLAPAPLSHQASAPEVEGPLNQHDLVTKYFRRDPVIFRNLDWLRAPDFMLLIIVIYASAIFFLPRLSERMMHTVHFMHALAWCLFHSFGLGLLLRSQSRSKYLVRHYLKNYHYPSKAGRQGAVLEAFTNWKSLYNCSLCMTYLSFGGFVWNTYSIPNNWTVGTELLRHTLGAMLVGLHVWASTESYEVLGVFGWFFGDFFMEEFPAHLEYTGIYRYLNNPEIIGGTSWFGLALISGSKLAVSLAVIRHLSYWWFLCVVENPHMRKLYGDSLRKEAGFVKVIRNVASKNARILELRAPRHAPEIRRVAREVKGTIDKVYEDTADAVEEFLAKSRPKISEVVQDTRVLLQQSREKMIITRVANDLSSYDTSKYSIEISPSAQGSSRFHVGEPISVSWKAPSGHSRRDWVGIYKVGANKSNIVTKVSSLGMWAPVHNEEWDGDIPLGLHRSAHEPPSSDSRIVVLKGDLIPWTAGKYEIRYHHDGKYNVMAVSAPLEVYVDKPETITVDSVRRCLMKIVPLCLDNDPHLVPLASLPASESTASPDVISHTQSLEGEFTKRQGDMDIDGRDPDDFNFWSERQARRICKVIKQAFDVEYATEVVVGDANVRSLAGRIVLSRELMGA